MKAKNRLSRVKSIVLLPSILMLIMVSINCLSFSAFADWETKGSKTYYVDESGKKVTGWQTIDDKKYYFASDGTMRTGWLKMKSGKSYYLRSDGSMVTGWAKIKGEKYYFDKNGVMATGDVKIGQKIYTFFDNGVMMGQYKDCFVELNDKYYYLDADGKLKTNTTATCQFSDGTEKMFYIGKNGYAISTEKEIDGIHYVFDKKEGLLEWYYPVKVTAYLSNKNSGGMMMELGYGFPKDTKGYPKIKEMTVKCKPAYSGYKLEFSGKFTNNMNKIISFRESVKYYDTNGNVFDEGTLFYISNIAPGETYDIENTIYLDKIVSEVCFTEGYAGYIGK